MTPSLPIDASLHRRTVLATGAAGATVLAVPGQADAAGHQRFRHGVASGDPLPRAVLIWTRVTPAPASTPGSGKGPRVGVEWEVATDRRFRHVVRRGRFATGPSRDHTVKVDVTGLKPGTWYHYRFRLDGKTSPVGRTRTAPARDASPKHLRFGIVSCANLQAGWFSAYRGLAARDDLHAVIHLGDYLYEYGPGEYGYGNDDRDIRPHVPAHEMVSLADYRQRHAQYPWIITWDDHEVANDQWSGGAENHDASEGSYPVRRARAHRAYDEWMPVRLDGTARRCGGLDKAPKAPRWSSSERQRASTRPPHPTALPTLRGSRQARPPKPPAGRAASASERRRDPRTPSARVVCPQPLRR